MRLFIFVLAIINAKFWRWFDRRVTREAKP